MKVNAEQVYTADWLRTVGSTSIVRTWELECSPAGYTTTTEGSLLVYKQEICRNAGSYSIYC